MERRFYIVKYDLKSFEKDPDAERRPGCSRSYADGDVAAPHPMGEPFEDINVAKARIETLMAGSRGEEIDIDLPNGGHYTGPRYYYTMGIAET